MARGENPMQLEDVVCRREAGSAVVEGVKQEWGWQRQHHATAAAAGSSKGSRLFQLPARRSAFSMW